jgi:uncharacterized membrane protein
MPTAPTVIPLIVAGLVLGSLLVSKKRNMSKKKLLGVSLLGGLLNAANAFIVYTLFPPTSFSRFGGGNFAGGTFTGGTFTGSSTFRGAGGASSEGSFLLLSFISGLLIVIVVVGVALAYVRYKSPKDEEQLDETGQEDQEELEEPKQGKEQEEI